MQQQQRSEMRWEQKLTRLHLLLVCSLRVALHHLVLGSALRHWNH